MVRNVLNSKIWIVEDGQRYKITRYEALLRTIADCALKQRDIRFIELFLKLAEQVDAADERAVAKAFGKLVMIDETMTDKEAADAYAATLKTIPGMIEPSFEIDSFEEACDGS